MSCLTNIIGLSDSNNPYLEDDITDACRVSDTGLYLDQYEGMPPLEAFKALATAERKTLEEKLAEYRTDGIAAFKEILYKELGIRYRTKSPSYVGGVGKETGISYLNIGFQYAGVAFDMQRFAGAEVLVKSLTPSFNFTGELNVSVYRAYNTGQRYQVIEKVTDFSADTQAGNPQPVKITPIALKATDDSGKLYAYLFVYELGVNQQPKDNGTSCGCGAKEQDMFRYLKPKGIQGTAADNMLLANATSYINGLYFSIEARCTGGDFICNNYYSNELIREALNWAILRKSAAAAMTDLITSRFISRETISNRDEIGMTINIANKKAGVSIAWIADQMNMLDNDCFECNPGNTGGAYDIQVSGALL